MFETDDPENNVYVATVHENLETQGKYDLNLNAINRAFISYFYRDELFWSLDNDWGITFNYMTNAGWSQSESLERIIDYLEQEQASVESLKQFLATEDHELDKYDDEFKEQMERIGL